MALEINQKYRDSTFELLNEHLKDEDLCDTLENKIYDYSIKYCNVNIKKSQTSAILTSIYESKITDIIENLKDNPALIEKIKDDQIIVLNPSIDDLLDCNIYKLNIGPKLFLVPLWHNELYFDGLSGEDIIVKCVPDLPANMTIDENNNLIVRVSIPFSSLLLKTEVIYFEVGRQKFGVQPNRLFIKPVQQFTVRKCGIAQIVDHANDMYNVSQRADIIFIIEFS